MTTPEIPSEQDGINPPDLVGEVPKEPIQENRCEAFVTLAMDDFLNLTRNLRCDFAINISLRVASHGKNYYSATATKTTEVR